MKEEMNYSEMLFNKDERLLDYITNLQERCEYLQRSCERKEDEIISLRDECVELNKLKELKDGK